MLCDTERDGHRLAFNEAFKQKGISRSNSHQIVLLVCPHVLRLRSMWDCTASESSAGFAAELPHEWSVEKYGELLTTGGGKERMTRYFLVGAPPTCLALSKLGIAIAPLTAAVAGRRTTCPNASIQHSGRRLYSQFGHNMARLPQEVEDQEPFRSLKVLQCCFLP